MRPISATLSLLALIGTSSAFAQSNSRQDAVNAVSVLQARSQLQSLQQQSQPQQQVPAWTPPASQVFHPYAFNNLGIGSTGQGNFITPHRSVDEIPGFHFNPATGQSLTVPTQPGPVITQPYPYVYPQPYYPYSYRPYYTNDYYSNGFYANGRYRGDNLNINFNLGSGLMPSMYDFGGLLPIRVGNYEYSINPYTGTYTVTTAQNRPDAYDARPRTINVPGVPAVPPPATREVTSLERAQMSLRDGEPERAVKELRTHLRKSPDDANAMRLLAVALLESGSFDDGVAVLRNAYRTAPTLADEPIAFADVGLSAKREREMLSEVVQYAHKVNSASAWLSVASIMQAEGRNALAKQMLDRAVHVGLDRETHKAFEQALR